MSSQPCVGSTHRRVAANRPVGVDSAPRYTSAHWSTTLSKSPQLRSDLAQAGLNVEALTAYGEASRSKNVSLAQLNKFLDPKQRGTTIPSAAAGVQPGMRSPTNGDWNASRNVDWRVLNGSRELSILCSETAVAHPETQAGQLALNRLADASSGIDSHRATDPHTGHRLDYVLPTKERFVEDAYYTRIIDLRRSQEGKPPERRMPPPVLYNGMCLEGSPKDQQQYRIVEEHHAAQRRRAEYIGARTKQQYGLVEDPTQINPAEYTNTQSKKQSITHCPSAAGNTYNRLFHLDAPPPFERTPSQQVREQYLRDQTSGGRTHAPISNAIIQVVPVSEQAQVKYALSGKSQTNTQTSNTQTQ